MKMKNYFTQKELQCRCNYSACDKTILIDTNLHLMLNKARKIYLKPINISSAYRCLKHNSNVGGVHNSTHTYGMAADILCTNPEDRLNLITALINVGFQRIGLSEKFIHVDIKEGTPAMWLY